MRFYTHYTNYRHRECNCFLSRVAIAALAPRNDGEAASLVTRLALHFQRLAKTFILILALGYGNPLLAKEQVLNLYIWGNYLPNEIIHQFTRETGIKVNLTEYDNNETMFAKIKVFKNPGYDVVAPSSYYVERIIRHNMLHRLDKSKIPNLKHLLPELLNLPFDLKNLYSLPHVWGTTGIIINKKYFPEPQIEYWRDLWNPKYKDQLMLLNDMRDVFGIALISLGYSINDDNPQHIEEAYFKLKKLLPNVKIFSIDTVPNIYIDEDATIGMAWSGDANLAKEKNQDITYIYPRDGFSLWVDNLVIIKDAPHIENAHIFINYLLRPDIAKAVAISIGYATANATTMQMMHNNNIDGPIGDIIKKGVIQLDLHDDIKHLYEKYWEKLKIDG